MEKRSAIEAFLFDIFKSVFFLFKETVCNNNDVVMMLEQVNIWLLICLQGVKGKAGATGKPGNDGFQVLFLSIISNSIQPKYVSSFLYVSFHSLHFPLVEEIFL